MRLGELIKTLEAVLDKGRLVTHGFGHPHSYRGYYECLAFEPVMHTTVEAILDCAKGAVGATFEGYKGGDFEMGEWTDVYVARYGDTGEPMSGALLAWMIGEPLDLSHLWRTE